MKIYSYTEQELSQAMNETKELFLNALTNYGEITKEIADKLNASYSFVAYTKGFWGKAYDKLTGTEPDKLYVRVVRHLDGSEESETEEATPNA